MKNYWKGIILVSIFVLGLLLNFPYYSSDPTLSTQHDKNIVKEENVEKVKGVLAQNLSAVNEQNIPSYLDTIVKEGYEDTQKVIDDFFKTNQIKQTLLNFHLVNQSTDEIVVRTKQKVVGVETREDYRDHIAETLYVFVLEENDWKIKESSITEIEFID